ncbi:MAG: hypothetical protein HWN81_02825 [Candidatus Lokiarchaeota archaeon]|nr:hypothetical protein [Candidatus Lokiarchaeota archaeon]
MIQSDRPKDLFKRKNNKKAYYKSQDDSEKSKNYLNIWRENPSFKDINTRRSITKAVSLLILTGLSIISVFITTENLLTSVILVAIFLVMFVCIFHDGFFCLDMVFTKMFRKIINFDPFESYVFWFNRDDREILYVHNKDDSLTFAMKIYSVKIIPENINPNVGGFIKSLSIKGIRLSYSYQVVQKPIINPFNENTDLQKMQNASTSTIGNIYFTVFGSISGILTTRKIDKLSHHINLYSRNLKSNLVTKFHHFKTKPLSDEALLNAIRVLYVGIDSQMDENRNVNLITNSIKKIFPKFIIFLFLLIYTGWIFSTIIVLDSVYVLLIVISLAFFLTFVWWRPILFELSRRSLMRNSDIDFLNPFRNVKFYTLRGLPYSIFMHIDNRLLIGMKMVSLKHIYNDARRKFDPRYDLRFEHFVEDLNYHKIRFTYTLKNEPLYYYTFKKYGFKKCYDNVKNDILFHPQFRIENDIDEERWLLIRKGMWFSFLTISANSYKFTNSLDITTLEKMEQELDSQIRTLKGAFKSNFDSYNVEDIGSNQLLSGYLFSVFKHNRFTIDGSHLFYLMIQGDILVPLSVPDRVLRRATDSQLPVEFNSPTHLRNFITIGHTINTEVFEKEVPFGFLYEQVKKLLIVNGTSPSRELTIIKIVSELILQGKPSLIFDFSGQWSKLFSLFEGSQYIDNISHFRLGAAFTTNPLVSDIPYDSHNTEYLEYMFDVFALAFKKDQRTIDMFRDVISKNPDMDFTSMQLQAQAQSDWQKTPLSYSLQNLFSSLSPQDRTYFQDLQTTSKILSYDFVRSEKTIIIDLSILKGKNKQLFFTFLILSKIIHYIKYKDDYTPKIIVIPNIDLFFEQRFLDFRWDYGKIDSFLDPLSYNDFGFIFSANQVSYLHPNIHTFFSNIISFRATDNKDVGILKNLFGLQAALGKGEYSDKRHNKYQVDYLKTLTKNNILVKRDDIYQAFPAVINWVELQKLRLFSYEQILTLMASKGYDLRANERRILDGARQTIFEKDLGHYYYYIEEIINFLKNISSVDRVANLYKKKVKEELKKILYPKLLQRTNKKDHMKKIHDEIFEKLLRHGYLVEDHSRKASGSESLATSYRVGEQYEEALRDYYNTRMETSEVQLEEVKEDIFPSQSRRYIIQQENLYDALKREFGGLFYDTSKVYDLIGIGEYSNAIKIEQIIIEKFLVNVYRHYYNIDRVVMPSEMTPLFELLEKLEGFPLKADELESYINEDQQINLDKVKSKVVAERLYISISNFYNKIKNFVVQE